MNSREMRKFFLSIVLPSILAVVLFIISFYLLVIPSFEKNMLDAKKEMISELTSAAWSLVNNYYQEYNTGNLSGEEAMSQAASRIEQMRYGDEKKDYFWITDRQPVMIMHPYRKDLNGTDLSGYSDPDGKRLFMDAVAVVERDGEGYIDYMWQWKDDTTLVAPKLSFVKGFEPWGWIIGTGIYLDDVNHEIRSLEKSLLWISFIIVIVILLALLFIIRSSMQIENRRREAEKKLLLSRQKYRNLVESSTIGTLMMAENRIIYVNQKFVDISGCTREKLVKKGIEELFNIQWSRVITMFSESGNSVTIEARIESHPDRGDVLLSVSRVEYGSGFSYIFVVNELSESKVVSRNLDSIDESLRSGLLLMDLPAWLLPAGGGERQGAALKPGSDHNFIIDLLGKVDMATDIATLRDIYREMSAITGRLFSAGAKPVVITALVSTFSDRITARVINLAVKSNGTPPSGFCFIAMGSQGRYEQTLSTDQDSGIIFDESHSGNSETARYFLGLGEKVSAHLNNIGYKYCQGGIMSSNPEWVKPLGEWKELFRKWVQESDPQSLLDTNIFFDFRPVYGESGMAGELRQYLMEIVKGRAVFFYHLSHEILRFRPPLGVFGNITGEHETPGSNVVDIKKLLMPITGFARLYSLQAGIGESNTLERIEMCRKHGVITPDLADRTKESYYLLMEARFRSQTNSINRGDEPSNDLDVNGLTDIQMLTFRKVLSVVNELITKVKLDFNRPV